LGSYHIITQGVNFEFKLKIKFRNSIWFGIILYVVRPCRPHNTNTKHYHREDDTCLDINMNSTRTPAATHIPDHSRAVSSIGVMDMEKEQQQQQHQEEYSMVPLLTNGVARWSYPDKSQGATHKLEIVLPVTAWKSTSQLAVDDRQKSATSRQAFLDNGDNYHEVAVVITELIDAYPAFVRSADMSYSDTGGFCLDVFDILVCPKKRHDI
jgi:hypothetical protein